MSNELIKAIKQALYQQSPFDDDEPDNYEAEAQAVYAAISDCVVVKGSAEPVAWMYERGHARHIHKTQLRDSGLHYYGEGWTETPLYARPPKVDLAGVEQLVGPSNAEQAEWPDAARRYVHSLKGRLQSLAAQLAEEMAENERLREKQRKATDSLIDCLHAALKESQQ